MKANDVEKNSDISEEKKKKRRYFFLWIIFISLLIIVSISTFAFYTLNNHQEMLACKLNCTNEEGKLDRNIDYNNDNVARFNVDKDADGIADTNLIDVMDSNGVCIKNCTHGASDGRPITNIDFNDDGVANVNIDTNNDGKPEINIDINGDGRADLNVDTDNDGIADINISVDGKKPNTNIDYYYDGEPTFNVVLEDGTITNEVNKIVDGKILNKDINSDGRPDINIDMNNDNIPDLNIDTNNDGKPDLNIDLDKDGIADINIDNNGDGICEEKCELVNVMLGNICVKNCDTNNDGFPDMNIDANNDDICDGNCDTDRDGVADVNIDNNGDGICENNCIGGVDNLAKIDGSINTVVLTNYKKVIAETKVYPGWEDKVVLNISNNTNEYISYTIKYTDVINEFTNKNNIIYELREDGISKSKTTLPYEPSKIVTLKIAPKFTFKYNLYLEFRDSDENQNVDAGKRFQASLVVDLSE